MTGLKFAFAINSQTVKKYMRRKCVGSTAAAHGSNGDGRSYFEKYNAR